MKLKFKIGPMVIELTGPGFVLPPLSRRTRTFEYAGPDAPDIVIQVLAVPPPARRLEALVSESVDQWRLYREKDFHLLEMLEQKQFQPRCVAQMSPTWERINYYSISLSTQASKPTGSWSAEDVVTSLVPWWLTQEAASRWNGLILHASAVSIEGSGFVFFGPSGSGKTTIARLCHGQEGFTVLNDERIFLWQDEGRWRVTGTPWSGMFDGVSSISVPLASIFSLEKATDNRLTRLPASQLVPCLISESFLPVWSPERMAKHLDTIHLALEEIPTAELHFTNDQNVVEFLRRIRKDSPERVPVEAP